MYGFVRNHDIHAICTFALNHIVFRTHTTLLLLVNRIYENMIKVTFSVENINNSVSPWIFADHQYEIMIWSHVTSWHTTA